MTALIRNSFQSVMVQYGFRELMVVAIKALSALLIMTPSATAFSASDLANSGSTYFILMARRNLKEFANKSHLSVLPPYIWSWLLKAEAPGLAFNTDTASSSVVKKSL